MSPKAETGAANTLVAAGTGDRAMAKLKSGGYYITIAGALASKVKPGVTQNMFINSDTNLNSVCTTRTTRTAEGIS